MGAVRERTPALGYRTILVRRVRPEMPLREMRVIAVHQRRRSEMPLSLGVCRKPLKKAEGTTTGDLTRLSTAEGARGT